MHVYARILGILRTRILPSGESDLTVIHHKFHPWPLETPWNANRKSSNNYDFSIDANFIKYSLNIHVQNLASL